MLFIRICIILILTILSFSHASSFAASVGLDGENRTEMTTNTGEVENEKKNINTSSEGKIEDEENPKIFAIEKNLQKLILEFAKIQGNNSLKNITQSFKKINPDTKSLLATYSGLQGQFSRIKKNIIDEGLTNSIRGDIIIPYCEYMIAAIEKKKKNIE